MRRLSSLILLTLLLTGCYTVGGESHRTYFQSQLGEPAYTSEYDRIADKTKREAGTWVLNPIEGGRFVPVVGAAVSQTCYGTDCSDESYLWTFLSSNSDEYNRGWQFLRMHEVIILRGDARFEQPDAIHDGSVGTGSSVTEVVGAPITREQLEALLAAEGDWTFRIGRFDYTLADSLAGQISEMLAQPKG